MLFTATVTTDHDGKLFFAFCLPFWAVVPGVDMGSFAAWFCGDLSGLFLSNKSLRHQQFRI
jgi:hypothetical protein